MRHPIKPYMYFRCPEEFFIQKVKISEICIEDDGDDVDISSFNPSNKFYFDKRSVPYEDYDEYYLVEYKEEKTPNANYAKELAEYEKDKAECDKALADYCIQEKLFKEWQAKRELEIEKETYERLKAKFEKP